MKTRLAAIGGVTALLVGGLFAAPAAAAGNSTIVVTAVALATTYPGSAYATAVVTGDGTPPAAGTVTYSFRGQRLHQPFSHVDRYGESGRRRNRPELRYTERAGSRH